jgi:FimV-like protein
MWASLLLTSSAYALNLGEITISSGFNEPLVATIPLEISPGTKLSDYRVDLQGLPAGVPGVTIQLVAQSNNLIKLTTAKPINHNYIQFDLVAKNANEERRQAYLVTFDKKTAPQGPKPLVYGPIKGGETLWNVAKAFSDHYNLPLDKAMDEVYQQNPKAFVGGKRDALMAGSYLRLPQMHASSKPAPKKSTAKAQAKAAPQPVKEKVSQEVATTLPVLPQMDTEGKAVAVNLGSLTGSLELLSPGTNITVPLSDTMQSILGKEDHAFVSLLDKIQSELSMAREAIDTERRAKEALQGQLDEMRVQLKALTELIHLKDKAISQVAVSAAPMEARPQSTRFVAWDKLPKDTAQIMRAAGNNQLVLLFLAIAVASFLIYLWDHLTLRRAAQSATPVTPPASSGAQSNSIKPQSLQQPPFLMKDIDVYVAHGRFSQAEDILDEALQQNPNDFDLLYKLFQVYVKSDNRFAYENKLGRISPRWKQKNPARWQRVHDLYERAWPMGFEGHGSGGGDDGYEGDPPSDPVQTKLDLAKAYIDIGNHENAVEILMEVVNEGTEAQVLAAQMLLSNIKH